MCASSYTGYNCESGKITISLLNDTRICIHLIIMTYLKIRVIYCILGTCSFSNSRTSLSG